MPAFPKPTATETDPVASPVASSAAAAASAAQATADAAASAASAAQSTANGAASTAAGAVALVASETAARAAADALLIPKTWRKPRTLALFGDSITACASSIASSATSQYGTPSAPAADNTTYRTESYWTWAVARTGNRLPAIQNAGIGSQTTTQLLARLATDVLGGSAGWVLVQGGSNDIGNGISAATTASNLMAICDAILAAGKGVILTSCVPHGTDTWQGVVNRKLRDYAVSHADCHFVDWLPHIQDQSTGGWASGMSDDTIHPNAYGASVMGRVLADVINVAFSPLDWLNAASNVDAEKIITNPALYGTGGSIGTSAGSIAANWTSRFGANATLSKVASTDGVLAPWQQIVYASPGYASGDMYATYAGMTVGNVVQAAVECQIDTAGLSAPTDLSLLITDNTGTGVKGTCLRGVAGTGLGNGAASILWPTSTFLLVTPPVALTSTGGFLFAKFSATAGTVRFRRAWFKKVI